MYARVSAISASVIVAILVCVLQFICFGCDSFTQRNFSLLQILGGVAGFAGDSRASSSDPHLSPGTVISAQTHHQLPVGSSIIRHKLAKQIQGSGSWSSLKVREMVARLFRAVADMDLRVTHKNEEINSKLASLQRTVLARSPESHEQKETGRTHSMNDMLSALSVLRSQVSAESERLDILNSTQNVQTSKLRNSLGSLKKRIVSDDANIKQELKKSQLDTSREIQQELSGVEEQVQAEQRAAQVQEKKQVALASDMQVALARLHKLVTAMHTKIASVDRAAARSGARYRSKFKSLEGSIDAADGMIESMKKEVSSRSLESDAYSKRHEETVRALAREVAKARLREKAEAAKVAALKNGLEVVEGDETLLHDQEKAIRSAAAQQAQEERAVKSRVDAADGRFQHLGSEVSGLRAWARNASRFDAGIDGLIAALPHHLAAMQAAAQHPSATTALSTGDARAAHVRHRHRDSARRRSGDAESGAEDRGESKTRAEGRRKAARHEDRPQRARRDPRTEHRRHAARRRTEEKSRKEKSKEGQGKRGQEADAECLVKGSSGGCVVKKGGRADCIVPGLDGGCIVRKLFSRKTG